MLEELDERIDGTCNFHIRARKNESMDSLIKRFVRKTRKEKLIDELINRKRFKKNTTVRREDYHKRLFVLKKLREREKLELNIDN